MAAVGHLDDLGDPWVVDLLPVGGLCNRGWNGVVLLAGNDQQWTPVRVIGINLGLGPRVQVGRGRLEQRLTRGGDGEGLVQLVGFLLVWIDSWRPLGSRRARG